MTLGEDADRADVEAKRDADTGDEPLPELIAIPHGGDEDERGLEGVGSVVLGGAVEQGGRFPRWPRRRG